MYDLFGNKSINKMNQWKGSDQGDETPIVGEFPPRVMDWTQGRITVTVILP